MKRILLILTYFGLCIQMSAQTESCMVVVNELTMQKNVWSNQKAIDFILAHKDSFDSSNELDMWFYNFALGTNYYYINKKNEALPYLRNICTFLDKYENELDLNKNFNLIECYYLEAESEYNIEPSKDLYINKLEKTKSILEKYNQTHTKLYETIISEIGILQSDLLSKVSMALQLAVSGKENEAIVLFEEIIDKLSPFVPKTTIAGYSQALANCYISVGKLNDAEQIYLKTLAELKVAGMTNHETYRNMCDALGVIYCQVHNYKKGKEYSSLSKQLHEVNQDFDDSYIRCLANCALAEQGLGNRYMAKILMDVALKYMRSGIGYKTSGRLIKNFSDLASVANINIDLKNMSNDADRMLQIRPYILLLSNAALINQEAGFWEDAVICMKESISLGEEFGESNGLAYNNMGTMYLSQSRMNEALPYFSKAVSLCKTDYEKVEVLFNYALTLWLLHSNKCSEIAIQTSNLLTNSISSNFSFLSQEEKYNYYSHFENYLPFLNLMLYESGDENQYGHIYDNILTTKGLLLRASNGIKEAIIQSGDEELIGSYDKMITLRQQIQTERDSTLRIDIANEIELLDKKLSRSAADYGAFAKFNSINWKDVHANLNSDDIAIEFYNIPIIQRHDTIQKMNGEPRYCAVILKDSYQYPKIVPLCKESELAELDEDSPYCTDVLNRLIWQPLEPELKGIKNIYFSADRELHQIGIEYAQLKDGSKINNRFNMYRLSSTRLLAETYKKNKPQNAILYGGLLYDIEPEQLIAESRNGEFRSEKTSRTVDLSNFRYGVKYLPGTKMEVEDICKRFISKNTECDIITDIAGTEESFKSLTLKNIGIIHLATHGFYWSEEDAEERSYVNFLSNMNNKTQNFEDRALLRSGLFFSGANIGLAGGKLPDDVEDGVLTAKELSVMNLGNVDMVVMSACQSGLGETSGEGVFGLQRGFKLAGANTLLMSLWKVDDEATRILMTEFYKNYLSGKTKRESLQLAQQTLRLTHPEPEYWASFILLDALN